MSGAEGGPGKRTGSNPDTAPRSDPYCAVVLSQQHDEAGGSLNREAPVRVASSPDNAGTDRYYRMVRVRQARQEGVREEPVF